MNVLFNCLAATRLISKSQHKKLGNYDRLSLNFHVTLCKYCKSFQRDLEYVKLQLQQIDQTEECFLNEDFKKELTLKILEELKK